MSLNSVIGALRVNLSANTAAFERGMKGAQAQAEKSTRAMSQAFTRLGPVLAAATAAFSVNALKNASDEFSDLHSRVGVAIGSIDDASGVMARLGKVADQTYSSIGQTTEGFLQNKRVLDELGLTTEQQLDYTQSLNNAMVVAGAKGDQATRVQKALSDAMSLGALKGDQFNTILMRGGPIVDALNQHFGVTTTELKQLASDGKITSDVIRDVVLANMELWTEQAAGMPGTFGDAATAFSNMVTTVAGRFNQVTDASGKFTEAVRGFTTPIMEFAASDSFEAALDGIGKAAQYAAAALAGLIAVNVASTLAGVVRAAQSVGAAFWVQYHATVALTRATTALRVAQGQILTVALSAVAYAFIKAYQSAKNYREIMDSMEERTASVASAIANHAREQTAQSFKTMMESLKEEYEGLETGIAGLENRIRTELKTAAPFRHFSEEEFAEMQAKLAEMKDRHSEVTSEIEKQTNLWEEALGAAGKLGEEIRGMTAEEAKATYELQAQKAALEQKNTLRELELQYGRDSVEYQKQVFEYARAEEMAQLDILAARIGNNEEAQKLLAEQRDAVNAAYDAESATLSWANAMESVRSKIAGIANLLASIGGNVIANADKFTTARLINEGMSRADAERQVLYAQQDRELEGRMHQNIAKYGEALGGVINRGLQLEHTGSRNADAALEAAYALDAERSKAQSNGGGGGRSGRSSGGGRGRGRSDRPFFEGIEGDIERMERQLSLLGKTKEEVAAAEAKWRLLDEAKRQGIPVNDQLNAQIDEQAARVAQLSVEMERSGFWAAQYDRLIEGISDSFTDALLAGESLRQGLANTFRQLARDIMKSGVQDAIRAVFSGLNAGGGGGGLLGKLAGSIGGLIGGGGITASSVVGNDALSGALRNALPAFATGVRNFQGGMALVGERGPELAYLNRGTSILNNHKTNSLLQGQSQAPSIHVSVDEGVRVSWLNDAARQSANISQKTVKEYDRHGATNRMNKFQKDPRAHGK